MTRIVCKFGGSSVAGPEQFINVKKILEADDRRKIIVPSAPGKRDTDDTKITDLLYGCHELAKKNLSIASIFSEIRRRFLEIHKSLELTVDIAKILDMVEVNISNDASIDYIASRGEYLCGLLMADFLGAQLVDPEKAIRFDSFGRISPDTYSILGSLLSDSTKIFVLPGFYGVDHLGRVKTFSRGGSDITGAIAARAINAALYENWTDVSGLLMADPSVISNPRPMELVTYREIRELSYMGAKVFHDEAIAPVREKRIPIQIKNSTRPDDPGTRIVTKRKTCRDILAGIAGKKNASIFSIEKTMMNMERGFGRKVLGIFESYDVSYEHSPTGIDSMNVIVLQEELGDKADIIKDAINRVLEPEKIVVHNDLALIATVGEGMQQIIGTAAKLFCALRDAGVNVRIIDQGSSEINIIIGVFKEDYEKAIQAIYKAFV